MEQGGRGGDTNPHIAILINRQLRAVIHRERERGVCGGISIVRTEPRISIVGFKLNPRIVIGIGKSQKMKEDFDWAITHHHELERQYSGESIAIWRKEVIAHGPDENELLRRAAAMGITERQLVVLEFPTFFESPR